MEDQWGGHSGDVGQGSLKSTEMGRTYERVMRPRKCAPNERSPRARYERYGRIQDRMRDTWLSPAIRPECSSIGVRKRRDFESAFFFHHRRTFLQILKRVRAQQRESFARRRTQFPADERAHSRTQRDVSSARVSDFSRLENPFGRVRSYDVTRRCTRGGSRKNTRGRARTHALVCAHERKHAVPKNSRA